MPLKIGFLESLVNHLRRDVDEEERKKKISQTHTVKHPVCVCVFIWYTERGIYIHTMDYGGYMMYIAHSAFSLWVFRGGENRRGKKR